MDWAAHWRELVEARDAQTRRLQGDRPDVWGGRADMFARGIGAPDPFLDEVLARLRPGETVLDVGAGSGRFAIPLAARAAHLTAVDSSPGMLERLQAEARERGLTNITTVEAGWDEANVAPADVVVCAHVVYFITDLVPFLRKLDEHTRRLCMIAVRVEARDAAFAPLFTEIWGEPRVPESNFIGVYNVLFEMGIVANTRILSGGGMVPTGTVEDLRTAVRRSLLDPGPEADPVIDAFLADHSARTEDGRLTIPGARGRMACVWWEKDGGQEAAI